MKTQIHIVTYAKDIPYLELNLRTIKKFASGFSGLTLVVPVEELTQFNHLTYLHEMEIKTYHRSQNYERWHLSAQCQKCLADTHCPNADFILHTDSDCIFTEPVTPDEYFVNGQPVMLMQEYASLPAMPWKAVTEAVLRRPVRFEFMRRHPQVNPIGIYSDLRSHIEKLHGMKFSDFVESRKPDYPWGFTEHNIIGAFAYYHAKWHDQYHWHNVATLGAPKEKLMQFWSHSDIDTPQEISHGGRYTPKEYTEKLLI